jgi:hypothetical protein
MVFDFNWPKLIFKNFEFLAIFELFNFKLFQTRWLILTRLFVDLWGPLLIRLKPVESYCDFGTLRWPGTWVL